VRVSVRTFSDDAERVLKGNLHFIKRLAKAREVEIGRDVEKPHLSATAVTSHFEIYVPVEGLLNIDAEIDRLIKEKTKVEESLRSLDRKLLNEDFLKRAPKEIIEKERARYRDLVLKGERLEGSIKRLKETGVKR